MKRIATLALGSALGLPLLASAQSVVNENFDDVTGLSSATSTRTVQNILSNNPGQLPSGSLWTSIALPPNAADVNVRRADNLINTSTGNAGFDSFFAPVAGNNFLLLGDQTGAIGGNPTAGIFAYVVPFTIAAGVTSVTINFDWAFDGTDTSSANADKFIAGVVGDGFKLTDPMAIFEPLVSRSSPSQYGTASFSQTLAVSALPVPVPFINNRYLVFALAEGGTATNSAVGIDNILITPVPEPEMYAFMLAGLGLVGCVARRRRGA